MTNAPPDHSEGTSSRYRAYLIGEDGRVASVIEIAGRNDEEAIAQVRGLTHSYGIELWDRGRVVVRLPTVLRR